jgi:hypothetical protein
VEVPALQSQDFTVEGSLRVIATKNETVEVAAVVGEMRGYLQVADAEKWTALDGSVTVPLSSWNSENELRDARILETFFQADQHPEARLLFAGIEGVDPSLLRTVEGSPALVQGRLEVAGGWVPVEAPVRIALAGGDGEFLVESVEPVSLSIQGLGLSDRLAALVTLCGHQSVLDTVSVEISAVLKPVAPGRNDP